MRRRLLVGLVLAAAAAGCSGGTAAVPGSTASTAPPPAQDPLADCVLAITPWLQTSLDGGTDLGDYQEMGLSSAQG
ncbi:hypothetical protein ABZ885_34500, partial [Kitasatospora sp. NPDC047058]